MSRLVSWMRDSLAPIRVPRAVATRSEGLDFGPGAALPISLGSAEKAWRPGGLETTLCSSGAVF